MSLLRETWPPDKLLHNLLSRKTHLATAYRVIAPPRRWVEG